MLYMAAIETRVSTAQTLWQAYRGAFREFEREAERLTLVTGQASFDPEEVEEALARVEQARLAYNDVRDNLAASMMSAKSRQSFWAIPASGREQDRVKSIAELFWQLSGKPQGSAEADWYRAERVVRHSGVEVCYAGR